MFGLVSRGYMGWSPLPQEGRAEVLQGGAGGQGTDPKAPPPAPSSLPQPEPLLPLLLLLVPLLLPLPWRLFALPPRRPLPYPRPLGKE